LQSTVPQLKEVNRAKAETLQVSIDDVFETLGACLGSTFVDQFDKLGQVFKVYVQADARYRLSRRKQRPAVATFKPFNPAAWDLPFNRGKSQRPAVGHGKRTHGATFQFTLPVNAHAAA
jgi:AcrB/AcrD/AcrF family